mmetsp:Transcript_35378/g.82816  ORF Transcript_35378/g.82816 Transcript_35378/m.82816 type:complete len:241 (+) Transcript_35378:2-724(+)
MDAGLTRTRSSFGLRKDERSSPIKDQGVGQPPRMLTWGNKSRDIRNLLQGHVQIERLQRCEALLQGIRHRGLEGVPTDYLSMEYGDMCQRLHDMPKEDRDPAAITIQKVLRGHGTRTAIAMAKSRPGPFFLAKDVGQAMNSVHRRTASAAWMSPNSSFDSYGRTPSAGVHLLAPSPAIPSPAMLSRDMGGIPEGVVGRIPSGADGRLSPLSSPTFTFQKTKQEKQPPPTVEAGGKARFFE